MANQRFDFDQATQLKVKLNAEADKLETELNQMMSQVEGVKEWWSGGSEIAFINNFKSTKEKIVKSLNECIDNYNKLVDQIAKAKRDSDADIARQLGI